MYFYQTNRCMILSYSDMIHFLVHWQPDRKAGNKA